LEDEKQREPQPLGNKGVSAQRTRLDESWG
jgi:hypothetical protein